ncbi:hypothetical protein TNCV_2773531 [Trichonephila clavipes]|nr:hypothetical protein TNCV_2773531 [Trichonephila clavipes]
MRNGVFRKSFEGRFEVFGGRNESSCFIEVNSSKEEELKRQEREDELEKLKIEASMMSNGFRRERNSQNEGIQEHVPVGLQKLMRTFDPKRRLKQLVIVEQMKEHVSRDMQQHFIDDWSRIVTVDDLAEKQELNNRSGYDKRNSFQKSVTCFNWGRVGHFARFCRDKKDGEERPRIPPKTSLDESVNTEEEEQEPTITEYDEENGNNTEKFKKQQHRFVILFRKQGILLGETKGGYVIENDILYHE